MMRRPSPRIDIKQLRIDWPKRTMMFQPAVEAFDESNCLPPEERTALVEQLAFAVLQAAISWTTRAALPPASKLAKRAESVANSARQLRAGWPLNLELAVALSNLEIVAERVAHEQRGRLRPRNARNIGKSSLESLLHTLFAIYASMRDRHPRSGRRIGLGGPLLRFISAVLKCANVNPGNDAHLRETVRGAYRRWRRTQIR
jgi:hypothetical protein